MKFQLSRLNILIVAVMLAACGGGGANPGGSPAPGGGNSNPGGGDTNPGGGTHPDDPGANPGNGSDGADATPPSIAAISSSEASVVRGTLRMERITGPTFTVAQFQYDVELGLDAQRRMVRFTMNNLRTTTSPNYPHYLGNVNTSATCSLSNVEGIFSCNSESADATRISTATLDAGTQADLAVLTQTERITPKDLQRNGTPAVATIDAQYTTLMRWTHGQLMEPLSSTWNTRTAYEQTGSGPVPPADTRIEGTGQATTARDGSGRSYVAGITLQGSGTSTGSFGASSIDFNDIFTASAIDPSGWTASAVWNMTRGISATSTSDAIRYNGQEITRINDEFTYDNGKFIRKDTTTKTTRSSDPDYLVERVQRMEVSRWGAAPAYDPLYTTRSGWEMGTYEIAPNESQWVESSAMQYASSGIRQASVLTLETTEPVYSWSGMGTNRSPCLLAGPHCTGYYAQGGLLPIIQTLSTSGSVSGPLQRGYQPPL